MMQIAGRLSRIFGYVRSLLGYDRPPTIDDCDHANAAPCSANPHTGESEYYCPDCATFFFKSQVRR